jgi:hypothetical protein
VHGSDAEKRALAARRAATDLRHTPLRDPERSGDLGVREALVLVGLFDRLAAQPGQLGSALLVRRWPGPMREARGRAFRER